MLTVDIRPNGIITTSHPYPKLMIANNNLIVLFKKENSGTLIKVIGSYYHEIGDYSDDWNMQEFIDYEGSITLTQKL